jgi:2-polyprenyl-3-methyl-5-hydroxy-6-metoxy-1,4-benzoquinol methylase
MSQWLFGVLNKNMKIIDNYSLHDDQEAFPVFYQENVPIFQHKVYTSPKEAHMAPVGNVNLLQSKQSGFIFNKSFDAELMNYDSSYHNEQANSEFFQEHLREVLALLSDFGIKDKKVVEIGCGKGVFFELMLQNDIDCTGFDPTYEGSNPNIIKEYFSEKYQNINADVVIMRHTLEHIPKPFSFIHTIAKANNYRGMLFVEVPTFDWIQEKGAFWDIFYEHCNYFTEDSLKAMFLEAQTGKLFGDQYIYLWADLSKLRNTIPELGIEKRDLAHFSKQFQKYELLLKETKSLALWGAGGKGSTFLNLLDKGSTKVKYVVDINPAKQNKFVARTGHPIYSPERLLVEKVDDILVMNENYLDEIRQIIGKQKINIHTL